MPRAFVQFVDRLVRVTLLNVTALVVLGSFYWVASRPWRSGTINDGRTELTVLHWGDKNEDAIVAQLVADFERQNPEIRVRRTNLGQAAQLVTKLQTMIAAGDPPDLFYLRAESVADFGSKGLLADIEEFVRADASTDTGDRVDLSDYFPAALDAFRFDGHRVGMGTLVGLPKDFTTVGFYYNKELFARAGLATPNPEGWTWDEFLAAARAMGRLPGCYGADFVTWEAMVRVYLFTHGLDFATPGFEQFCFHDPELRKAIERLRSWFHDEERTLLSAKTQLETGQEPFLAGNIGLAGPFGRWKVPTYRRIDSFDWDFAPLPHVAGRPPSNGVFTVAWAMSRQNRHPQESWRLMKYLCSRQGQEIVCETGLAIPVLKSVAYSRCFNDPDQKPENDEVFLTSAEHARYIEWPNDPRYMDQLKTRLEEIFKLGEAAGPVLDDTQRSWEANREATNFGATYTNVPWKRIAGWIWVPSGLLFIAMAATWWFRRPSPIALREETAGWIMLSPWVIGFLVFTAFPIVLSLLLAFTQWTGLVTLGEAEWVGWDNYRKLLRFDPTFRQALIVTAWYALLAVPTGQLAALAMAGLLSREIRGISIFRALFYLPSVLAGVGLAILWKWVFHHEHGLLNTLIDPLLSPFGLATPAWFERDAQNWGVPAFAIINLWAMGGTMMIYLAGLKGIPRELHEAAQIDGATGARRFAYVTLPMLSPVIFFNVIMALIASFQVFTQVFVMTGGGPGTATHFFVFYIYKQAFDLHQMGYASALAWLLLLIVLALTLVVMRGSRRWVYYEALKA